MAGVVEEQLAAAQNWIDRDSYTIPSSFLCEPLQKSHAGRTRAVFDSSEPIRTFPTFATYTICRSLRF